MARQQCVCGDCAEDRSHISEVLGEYEEVWIITYLTKKLDNAGYYEGEECKFDHDHATSKSCSMHYKCEDCGDTYEAPFQAQECCSKWECNFCGYVHGNSAWSWGGSAKDNAASCCAYSCDECDAYGWPEYMENHSCEGEMGIRQMLPWERRGIVVNAKKPEGGDEWREVWDLQPEEHDVVQASADYYLLEAMKGGLVGTTNGKGEVILAGINMSTTWKLVINEASDMFDALVKKWDPILQRYTHMACGGELRHHVAVGGNVLSSDRDTAWNGWKLIFEAVGADALKDAADLFREFGGGAFGGEKWADACEILHARVTHKITPALFLDRVFNAQHNGGALLNKVQWAGDANRYTTGKYKWSIDEMQSRVLPAHGAEPEPDYSMLLAYASDEVRQLFRDCFEYAGHAAKEYGVSLAGRMPIPKKGVTSREAYNYQLKQAQIKKAAFLAMPKWLQTLSKADDYTKTVKDYESYAEGEAKQNERMALKAANGKLPGYMKCTYHSSKNGEPCKCMWYSDYYAKLVEAYKKELNAYYEKAAKQAMYDFGYIGLSDYGYYDSVPDAQW